MKQTLAAIATLTVINFAILALNAQTSGNFLDIKAAGLSNSCTGDPGGNLLCSGTDGLAVFPAGGGASFKLGPSGAPAWTKLSCTTVVVSNATGLTASNCTVQ